MGFIVLMFSFMLGTILALIWSAIEAGHKARLERRRLEKINALAELLSGVYYDRREIDTMMKSLREEYRFIMDDISVTVNNMIASAVSQFCDRECLEELNRSMTSSIDAYFYKKSSLLDEEILQLKMQIQILSDEQDRYMESISAITCSKEVLMDYVGRESAAVRKYVYDGLMKAVVELGSRMDGEILQLKAQMQTLSDEQDRYMESISATICSKEDLENYVEGESMAVRRYADDDVLMKAVVELGSRMDGEILQLKTQMQTLADEQDRYVESISAATCSRKDIEAHVKRESMVVRKYIDDRHYGIMKTVRELVSRVDEIPQYVKTTVDSATSDFCVREEMKDYIFKDYRMDMEKVREYVTGSVSKMRDEYAMLRSQINHFPELMKSMTDYAAAGFCARNDLKVLSDRTDKIEGRLRTISWTYEKFGGFSELEPRLKEAEDLLSRIEKRSSRLKNMERRLSHFQSFYDMMELDGLWAPFKSEPADDDQSFEVNQ